MDQNSMKARLDTLGRHDSGDKTPCAPIYETWALPLLAAWPKVLSVIDGGIPDPEVVELFPTNHCNLKCPHCRFRMVHGDRSQHMSLTTFETLLGELSTRGVNRLELSGGGEPLDHPNALDMFALIHDRKFRVGLITNAYALVDNPMLTDAVSMCADWIRVSVDGFTDATYRKVHGKNGLQFQALREVIQHLATQPRGQPQVGVKMLISRLNANDVELAIPIGLELGAHYMQFKFLGFATELALSDEHQQSLSDALLLQMAEYSGSPMRIEMVPPFSGEKTRERCLMTFLHPVIDWDGSIYLCAFFEHRMQEHSIGNIKDGGFFRHWDASKHRDAFDAIDPMTCLPNCPMRRYSPLIEFIVRNDFRKGYI